MWEPSTVCGTVTLEHLHSRDLVTVQASSALSHRRGWLLPLTEELPSCCLPVGPWALWTSLYSAASSLSHLFLNHKYH